MLPGCKLCLGRSRYWLSDYARKPTMAHPKEYLTDWIYDAAEAFRGNCPLRDGSPLCEGGIRRRMPLTGSTRRSSRPLRV